jgi:MinD superfamily P-loop ATPase
MVERQSGNLYASDTRIGPLVHAKLLPGEGNSGRLVTEVRKLSTKIATDKGIPTVLIDGSPGIGCPVIATVTGINLGVIVTEPTLSGIHDMQRVSELLQKFRVKTTVIINKYDLNLENTEAIERYCASNDIEVLAKIKFDSIMTKSMVATQTLPEFAPDHEISHILGNVWNRIIELLPA